MTEVEVLPSDDPRSYDYIDKGRFFSFSRLKGDTGLTKMHTGYKVDGEDKRIAQFDSISALKSNRAHSRLAYIAGRGGKKSVVIDGVAGPSFDMVVTPQFTPDGSLVIYRVRDKGERFVVSADLQGKTLSEHQRYESVWNVTVAPDGKTVGYGIKNGLEYWWKVEKL